MLNKLLLPLTIFLLSIFIFSPTSYSGFAVPDSDTGENFELYYFFDLRERESFIQLTNIGLSNSTVHVQIFDVGNNCNENDFFDTYTPNDTHVYNMREILTNNGNPSGVVLPDGAYGVVSIITVDPVTGNYNGNIGEGEPMIGNFRIVDDLGYEYRTNSLNTQPPINDFFWFEVPLTFNFNTVGNVTLSDVVGMTITRSEEVEIANITEKFFLADINILNENEVVFSCRNVVFACTDQDNPLLEETLEIAGANIASFEYGINEAIPHSKGGELLCPGNNISDGIVTIQAIDVSGTFFDYFIGYIGLNNGNGRGSMDSFWHPNQQAFPDL